MNIAVIGAGYVGLVTGACLAELGNQVVCIDINEEKIQQLKKRILPIYEPGLDHLLMTNSANHRLTFATSLENLPTSPEIIFIAVGTPGHEGSVSMEYVLQAAKSIGKSINQYCVVVDKSTVLVGTTEQVKATIEQELAKRQVNISFDIVSNPEFLREGAAIEDFMRPDRIIIGSISERANAALLQLYLPVVGSAEKIYFMKIKEAELTKYAANAMLATRISFMNEIALLCERLGVDVENVRKGIGSDSRIGNTFIYPGCGYGGSCFPKDMQALIRMAIDHQIDPLILRAVEQRNRSQKQILFNKITKIFGDELTDKTIALWGLSFKPDTDDIREAPSLTLIEQLIQHNVGIQAYDPVALPAVRKALPADWFASGHLRLVDHPYHALENADLLVLVTEWKIFANPDLNLMKKTMRRPIVLDGRNQYAPSHMRQAGFEYYAIGR